MQLSVLLLAAVALSLPQKNRKKTQTKTQVQATQTNAAQANQAQNNQAQNNQAQNNGAFVKAPQFVPASVAAVSLAQADKIDQIVAKDPNSKKSQDLLTAADEGLFPAGINNLLPVTPSGFCAPLIGQANIATTVGAQFKKGGVSCSSNIQGMVPAIENMVSTIIVEPKAGVDFDASKDNNFTVQINNLVSGFFSNANAMYYLTPQTLNNGKVQGHQHVVVQQMNGNNVMNPREFQFFKGINQAATDPAGTLLNAAIPAGSFVVNGLYRFCSITGADTHQPILSPILARGPQGKPRASHV
ncbi:hypothetical protein HDU91_006523 [Kappamyces sp. JEL0680]|nr:hypothetical protein HDU91_006523 [Kappamyces sp. JEL0680]